MYTITTKISDETYACLEEVAKLTDRNKSYIARKAIEEFLQEKADYLIAIHRLEQRNDTILLDDLERECGLES